MAITLNSSSGGLATWRWVRAPMLDTTMPAPSHTLATANATIPHTPWPTGISSANAAPPVTARRRARALPSRAVSHGASDAPSSAPTPSAAISTPTSAGAACSSRTRNTGTSAMSAPFARLSAVAETMHGRITGCRTTKCQPSRIWAPILGRSGAAGADPRGSPRSRTAGTRKLTASSSSVGTAPRTCTTTPPRLGPPSRVAECVADTSLLRAVSSSRLTIEGRKVWFPTSNTTLARLITSAAPTRCASVRCPSHHASGTDAMADARRRSIATCVPRSGSRATNTPAGSPITAQAR